MNDAIADGEDTALARLLHAEGVLDLDVLQECLEAVRSARVSSPNWTLASLLVARGLVPEPTVRRCMDTLLSDPQTAPEGRGPAASPATPQNVGPYRVVRLLGQGGMGAVYEVVDPESGAHYALKLLHTLATNRAAEELVRLRREAEVMAQFDHPNLANIHAAEFDTETPYLVLDLLPGGTLQDRLKAGPLSPNEALRVTAAQTKRFESQQHWPEPWNTPTPRGSSTETSSR